MRTSLNSRRPGLNAATAELDVTPVMNMFIILIPLLIGMAAFTKLTVHELNLPGDADLSRTVAQERPPLVVAVGEAGVLIAAGDVVLAELPRKQTALDSEELDLAALTAVLTAQAADRVVLAVDGEIAADEVVACLDAARAAGCTDVGLAAGTGVVLSGEATR